jgi:hypothetical protein
MTAGEQGETNMTEPGRSDGVRVRRALAWSALAVGLLTASAREARADQFKDEKLGYSLNTPGKWSRMPIATDEKWIVAEWKSQRQWEYRDPKTDQFTLHEPKLDVVVIPNSAAKQKAGEVVQTDDKIIIKQAAPWKDLKEYMDKKAQTDWEVGGGYFFSEPGKESKVGDMKVLYYEVTFDKLTTPRKWFGWAFYAEDCIYGVVGDSLVKFEEKIKPEYDAAIKSFKIFPRTGMLPGAAITGDDADDVIFTKDPKKEHVTDEDLKKKRMEAYNRRLARIKETLPSDWKIKESENFTAVSHCDDKFTKEVLDHAEALRDWLDKTMGYVGAGYAGKIILRVCADSNEREAMWKTMSWQDRYGEVVTGKDRDGWMDNAFSSLNTGIYEIWLTDRNRDLSWQLPYWMRYGLDQVIGTARSKGRKITDFKASTWDTVGLNNLRRANKLLTARQFFTMDLEELFKDYENMRQAEAFIRFLMTGAGHTNSKYKTRLGDYIKNMAILIDERKDAEAKDKGGVPEGFEEPKNEEEEAAMRRKRSEAWKSDQQAILKKLMEETFPKWEDKDWDQFNNAYWKELGA